MEENVSYRYLKKKKPICVNETSQSLLHRPSHKSKQYQKGIMAKNVSLYQHMMVDPHVKENYIDWAINLREGKKISIKQRQDDQTPSVYYKTTEQSKKRSIGKGLHNSSLKASQFSQFFGKNSEYATEDSLNFIQQLRKNSSNSLENKQRFINTPKKDRNQLPILLKKNAIKKTRNLQKSDFEKSFDGDHNFAHYSYSNLKQRNAALLETLSPIGNRLNVSCLGWQVGLRNY